MNDRYEVALVLLREQGRPAPDQGEGTRQRVLATLAGQPRVRRIRRVVVLAFAACFVFSTALAYFVAAPWDARREGEHGAQKKARARGPATGGALAARAGVLPGAGTVSAGVHPAAEQPASTGVPREPDERQAASGARADRITTSGARHTQVAAPARPDRDGPASARAASATASAEREPSEADRVVPARSGADARALYLAAHRLHFRGAPDAALAAWNAYLAARPQGPLAVEARYNRGVVLARLGRWLEAREALEPFARGEFGEFRKADAAELLQRIGAR